MKTLITLLAIMMLSRTTFADEATDNKQIYTRTEAIESIRKTLNDPTTTLEKKASLADFELQLLDQDSQKLKQSLETSQVIANEYEALKNQATNAAPVAPVPTGSTGTQPTQTVPQGENAGGLTAGAVQINKTSESDAYVQFGWKVPVTNTTDHDAKDVTVQISCRDKNDIELDIFTSNDNAIPAGGTVNVTDSTVTDASKWKQADHWVVKIKNH